MALRWGLKPRQLLEAAQKHPVFDARENLSQRKTLQWRSRARVESNGNDIESIQRRIINRAPSSATSLNVGRACVGEGFPGASKTWMFLGSLHGRIHGGPGKPSPTQAHTLSERRNFLVLSLYAYIDAVVAAAVS